jgi:DivIVA domain-containing protein
MGIFIAVGGWTIVCLGTIGAGKWLHKLAKTVRNKASASAVLAEASLLIGWMGSISLGALYVRYPHNPHDTSLRWLPVAIYGASMAILITAAVVHLARRGNSPAATGGSDSVSTEAPAPAVTLDDSTENLIERIKNVTFSTTRLRPGYVIADVHAFLNEVARAC